VRNLPNVHTIWPDQLNTYDVLVNDDVVFTKSALDAFLAGPVKGRQVKATARSSEVESGPYGAGSHAALADGSEPDGFPVKGNESSKIYHLPGTSFYNRTKAEVWFATAEDAEKAGFQLPPSQRKSEEGDK
jgi:large subunit ribosomal protein L4